MTYIEHIQKNYPEQLARLEVVAKMMVEGATLGQTLDLVFGEQSNKVDTAYPSPYVNEISNVYPGIRRGNLCFSYAENKFGELVNLNDKFFKWLFQ